MGFRFRRRRIVSFVSSAIEGIGFGERKWIVCGQILRTVEKGRGNCVEVMRCRTLRDGFNRRLHHQNHT